MQQKRAPGPPFPIFAGNVHGATPTKRPRIALYTHPNNIIGTEEPSTKLQQSWTIPSWKKPQEETWPQRQRTVHNQENNQSFKPARINRPTQPPQSSSSHTKSTISQPTATSTATHSSSGVKAVTKPKSYKSRIITATGHSIYQWSSLTTQQHIIYEIFGVVMSPVSAGNFGSKQFILKTTNGTLKCCFWELMGIQFPCLVRGKLYRVMGTWDRNHQFIKCINARLSTHEEEQFLSPLLDACNHVMKGIAVCCNEQ